MSDSGAAPRPRQLTVAGGFVVAGSLFLLLSIFDSLAALDSVDTRAEVEQMLDSASGQGLGLTVAQALTGMRIGLQVAAVCAAAALVLGVFVLRRHNGARLALSVVAVPILLTSPLSGGLLGIAVAVATATLWSGPARDWFAGRPVREAAPLFRRGEERKDDSSRRDTDRPAPSGPTPQAPESPVSAPVVGPLSTGQPSQRPPESSGFGAAPVQQPGVWPGQPAQQQVAVAAPAYAPFASKPPVPGQVRIACLLTWGFSGLVALMYVGVLAFLVIDQDQLVRLLTESEAWAQAGLDESLLVPVLWIGCLLFLGWALGAMALAWLTWRRHNWARYLLVTSAVVAAIAATFAFPIGLVHQIVCVAVVVLLVGSPARAWFALPEGSAPYFPPGPPTSPPVGPTPPEQAPEQAPPAGPAAGSRDDDKPPVW